MIKAYLYLILFILVGCSPAVKYTKTEKAGIYLNDSLTGSNADINKIINPYKDKLDETMNEVLNTSDMVLERNTPEGSLGNFITDLCMTYATQPELKADFCVLNNGGFRVPVPSGNITRGKLFELMPFENELVIITLNGELMIKMFDYIRLKKGIPISKELNLTYDNWNLVSATIHGVAFDSTKTYHILTSDYLSRGGDNMHFFTENIKSTPVKIKLRDAIIDYVINEKKENRSISAVLDGRITNNE